MSKYGGSEDQGTTELEKQFDFLGRSVFVNDLGPDVS
jgi:hypothetical protein